MSQTSLHGLPRRAPRRRLALMCSISRCLSAEPQCCSKASAVRARGWTTEGSTLSSQDEARSSSNESCSECTAARRELEAFRRPHPERGHGTLDEARTRPRLDSARTEESIVPVQGCSGLEQKGEAADRNGGQ